MTGYGLRVISMLLTVLYTFLTLSTCSARVATEEASPLYAQNAVPLGQSGGVVTMNIFQPYGEISMQLQEAADAFVAEHPGTQIRIHSVDGAPQYQPALRAKLLGGEQVDLFHVFGYQDWQELREYALDLSDMGWIADADSILLEPVSDSSGIYGVPYSLEGVGLIANRDIFEAANIPLADIQTFEDLADAFQELRGQIDSGELEERFPELRYVTEFPALDKTFVAKQLVDLFLTDAFATPQQTAQAKLVDFQHSESLESYVKLMARYSSSRADWEGLNAVSQTMQVESGLAGGRVAVIQQNVNIWPRIYRVDPDLAGRLALLPIPLDEAEESSIYVGAPSYWAVNAQSSPESAALAKEFLTWLYQSEKGEEILLDNFGILSPYRESGEHTGVSLYTQLVGYLEADRIQPFLHSETPGGWAADVFMANLRGYFASEELDWEKMMSENLAGWTSLR